MTISFDTLSLLKVALIGVLIYGLFLLSHVLLIILTAVVISTVIQPAVRFFSKYKIPRALSVLLIYLLIFSTLSLFFAIFVPSLVGEINRFLLNLPGFFEEVAEETTFFNLFNELVLGDVTFEEALSNARSYLLNISGNVYQAIVSIFGGFLTFFLIIILSFYLAVRESGVSAFLELITPPKHFKYVNDLWQRTQKKLSLWIRGAFFSALIVSSIIYLGLSLLGLPYAFFLAVIAFFFEFIPMAGPTLSAIPGVFIAFVIGGLPLALIVLLFYVAVQQFDGNVVYPLVVNKLVGVAPLVVIIAVAAGATLGGLLGAVVGVPVAVGIAEFAGDVRRRHKKEEELLGKRAKIAKTGSSLSNRTTEEENDK